MRLERTHDMSVVEEVINHPVVVSSLTDSEDWNVMVDVDSIHYMLVMADDDEVLGLFILIPKNQATVSVHTAFLPRAYGSSTLAAAELLKEYIFNDIEYDKVVTEVPAFNVLARGYAQNSKLVHEGTWKKAYKHEGVLYDLYQYGLTKEEYKCQQ